jgi:hypothetical protein
LELVYTPASILKRGYRLYGKSLIFFSEMTQHEVKEFLKRYIDEILQLENIKARVIGESKNEFECLLVNRNKINTESLLRIIIDTDTSATRYYSPSQADLTYSITDKNQNSVVNNGLTLSFDDYHLF